MTNEALTQARMLLAELLEAARKGQIIPVRLPAQLEAIQQALEAADQPADDPATPSGDLETYRTQLAGLLSHGFHDLRLPLTSIRGYADMLANPAMGELSSMQQQFLTTIRTNTRRMETLLGDVSDLSKLRGGTIKVTPKMDMFKNIALMVEKQMRPVAQELGRELEFDLPQGLPILNTDGDLLAKALGKLVENGLRYSAQGEGRVHVGASAEGSLLHIYVEDNGIGMTPEEIARLGEPYYRADQEAVLAHKGSGLGVAIAFGLIDLLGGRVSVESQPGQGTRITITLTGMT